jgi:tetratricopeptide (TPR) repeat protein
VSYVSQRAECLASALYVATLLLLLARPSGDRRPWGHWAAALATFTLGLAAKPIVVTLPAAWVAITLAAAPSGTPRAGGEWRRRLPVVLPIAIAAVAFAIALLVSLRGRPDAGFSVPGTSPWLYFLTQLRALVVYLRLLAWPAGQSIEWAFPTSTGLAEPATLGAALAILGLATATVLLLVRGRRHATPGGAAARLAGLGLAWFFIVLSVTSSVVPLADPLVEHRVYLASWGIFLAAVVAADALAARLGLQKAALAAYLAVVVVLGVLLFQRAAVWESKEAVWVDALLKAPHSARARMSLGHAYHEQGRTQEALRQYELALPDAARSPSLQAQILRNIGAAHFVAGRKEEAWRAFAAGLELEPDNDELLVNMAFVAGDPAAAERLARRALEVRPDQPVAWIVIGSLALERKDWAAALAAFDRAAALDPDRGEAHYNRSLALGAMGRRAEACAALRASLQARLLPEDRTVAVAREASRCGPPAPRP